MVINYDIMEDILDDNIVLKFSKPNRMKTHPTGLTKYDDPNYKDGYRYNTVCRNWDKIKGILKKNVGKDFGKVKNEIIKKCAHSDYDKYLIRDCLHFEVFSYAQSADDNLGYLNNDMFYLDKYGKLRYRTKSTILKNKDSRYAQFPTLPKNRIYKYTFKHNNIWRNPIIDKAIDIAFCRDYFDYEIRIFKEDEVDRMVNELISLSSLIKSLAPIYYEEYKNKSIHYGIITANREFNKGLVKSYLFDKYCVNPYTFALKNSQEYWQLRKAQKKLQKTK